MTNYSAEELKLIAKISANEHAGLLTNCGINLVNATKIIAMSTGELNKAVAQFSPMANKTSMQSALLAAAARELTIRTEG